MKICCKCKVEKDFSEFNKDKRIKSGYRGDCKKCRAIARNREAERSYNQKYYRENQSRILEQKKPYRAANKERISIVNRAWRRANLAKDAAKVMRRKAAKLQATPAWADHKLIELEYELAAWCTQVMGEPYHVDHIVPLQGKTVCGLHVHQNLRVIPAVENLSKGNKHI